MATFQQKLKLIFSRSCLSLHYTHACIKSNPNQVLFLALSFKMKIIVFQSKILIYLP